MSRASSAANGMVKAVEDYCQLYRVPFFRMQSRAFEVAGAGGKKRPMFMGEWTDLLGQSHKGGMADLLLMPTIKITTIPLPKEPKTPHLHINIDLPQKLAIFRPVPLWVEVKSGTGRLNADQQLFRDYIEQALGTDHYLLIQNEPQAILDWFREHQVIGT